MSTLAEDCEMADGIPRALPGSKEAAFREESYRWTGADASAWYAGRKAAVKAMAKTKGKS